jgi:hypothetical protein
MARTPKVTAEEWRKFIDMAAEYGSEAHHIARVGSEKGFDELPSLQDIGTILMLGTAITEMARSAIYQHGNAEQRREIEAALRASA